MATLQRVSKSQVLRELLEAAEPALQRAVVLMEAASGAASAMKESLAQSLDKAQSKAEAHLAGTLAQMDQTTLDLVQQAEAIRGRRPAAKKGPGVSGARNPPSSNRGVKSQKTTKTSTRTRRGQA
jgi:hypothetical protein